MNTNSGSWDFTSDSEQQIELSDDLNQAADQWDNKVGEIYSDVSEMGTYWSGSDYDSFKDGTDGYKNALSDLGNSLRMYGKQFEKLSEGTDELSKKLIDIVDTCTTRNVD